MRDRARLSLRWVLRWTCAAGWAAIGAGCVNSPPVCGDHEFYRPDEHGGECVSWSPAAWRDSIRHMLSSVESVLPVIVQAAEDSLPLPMPDESGQAREVLRAAERGFPQIPFAIPLEDAPGHHTVRFHADEAVTTVHYGMELIGWAEKTEADPSAEVERGRYFLRRGLPHYHLARRLLDELPRIDHPLPRGTDARRDSSE